MNTTDLVPKVVTYGVGYIREEPYYFALFYIFTQNGWMAEHFYDYDQESSLVGYAKFLAEKHTAVLLRQEEIKNFTIEDWRQKFEEQYVNRTEDNAGNY